MRKTAGGQYPVRERERERERESYGVPNPGPNLPVGSGPSNMGSNLVRGDVCVCARPPALSASLPPSDQPTHLRDTGKLLSKARFEPEGRSSIPARVTTAPSVPGGEGERERERGPATANLSPSQPRRCARSKNGRVYV